MSKIVTGDVADCKGEFQIDIVGIQTKKRFMGDFKCQILNIKDRAKVERHNAMLNGGDGAGISGSILMLHWMLSYLRYALIETPKFWEESDQGYELNDANVIKEIYENVIEFENEWHESIWGKVKGEEGSEETDESKGE